MKAIEDVSTETTWIQPHIVPDNTFTARTNITYEPIGEVKNCRDYIKRNNVVYSSNNVGFEPVSIGSTCPWYFVRNIDPNRIPRVITEAECACTCCGKPDNQCKHNRCSISHKPKLCQKIYTYRKVLRRTGCVNGEYTYSQYIEPISVGCTCSRCPKTITRRMHS